MVGHCDIITSANHFHIDHHGAHYLGFSNLNGLTNGAEVDVLRIRTGVDSISKNPYNRFYRNDNNKSVSFQTVRGYSNFVIGLYVRRSGVTTGTRSGEISSNRLLYILNLGSHGSYRAHGWETTATADGGDSGGPFWRIRLEVEGLPYLELIGFYSAGRERAWFASQQDAKDALGLSHFALPLHAEAASRPTPHPPAIAVAKSSGSLADGQAARNHRGSSGRLRRACPDRRPGDRRRDRRAPARSC
jgi:hypothetical protein